MVQLLPRRTVATASQQKRIINLPVVAFFGTVVSLFILNVFTACRTHVTDTGICSNLLCVGPYVHSRLITAYVTQRTIDRAVNVKDGSRLFEENVNLKV